ncbi:UDP-glucuronic acid decarboxylase 1 [Biscogniauxia marginata]|nr:UDP-glucuronic acid decarboxylase 1 [Biscogniauxia marginata]
MPTILVTGGAGFLGSNLVSFLLENAENKVVAMDSLWTGSMDSISNVKDNPRFRFIRHDVTQPFPDEVGSVERIYHLACPASPKRFPESPLGILSTCFKGTENVLELAAKIKARVLLASTSEIYGDPLVCPQPETYHGNTNPFGPRSCYDEGKRVAEALAYAFRKQQNVDIRIGRIFNAYGPGLRPDDGRVVPNFVVSALASRDVKITGDGTASRCFQYVSDCVEGLVCLMESSYLKPVNIGCVEETTVGDLARLISDIVARKTGNPPVKISLTAKREDDPYRRVPDTTVASQELGWAPKVGLTRGLETTVDWFMTTASASA